MIDKDITMGDLMNYSGICQGCIQEDTRIRLRPHHFNFTKTSAEVDFRAGMRGRLQDLQGRSWVESWVPDGASNVLREGGSIPMFTAALPSAGLTALPWANSASMTAVALRTI